MSKMLMSYAGNLDFLVSSYVYSRKLLYLIVFHEIFMLVVRNIEL